MSMTPFQREGLQLLGYSSKESEFLFLVATHSGYFTVHQFRRYTETGSGSVSHAFIRKLLEHKHATYRAYRSGERVYHLYARKVYKAIDREHLRTRKKHEIEYVKTRLVTLDFVLAHPEHRYLETEQEKVKFFDQQYKLGTEVLPVKLYRARRSAEVTPRYFVDRFPMYFQPVGEKSILTFTYVDTGAVTLDAFRTHLRAYLPLFQALPAFQLVYIAPTPRSFQAAEAEFQRAFRRSASAKKVVGLLDYFRLRRAWDTKERVTSAEVILLQEARHQYAGEQFEELYAKWRDGTVRDLDLQDQPVQSRDCFGGEFRTELCGESLKVFANPAFHLTAGVPETDDQPTAREISGDALTQLSGS